MRELVVWVLVLIGGGVSRAWGESTLYRGATVFTLTDGENSGIAEGFVLVSEEGVVEAVGKGDPLEAPGVRARHGQADWRTVDLAGKIILPGFVSGHSHLWQSAFRGLAPAGELHPWLQALHWTYGAVFADGDFAAFTLHGAFDQLRHGVTTTYNHSQWLGRSYARYREQWEAEMTTPQWFVFAWVNERDASVETWRERLRPILAELKPAPQTRFLGMSINPRGLYGGASPDILAREIALARELGLTVQLHYLEPSAEAAADRANWPKLREAAVLGRNVSFAHFIPVDPTILAETSKVGNAMIWNPLSNGRLGSGLPDILGYQAAGLRVGMGVDGQASADISDPFENVRLGLYALRMRQQNAGGLQPIDMLRRHTLRTAEVLGVDRWVGSLEPGKFADFLVIDPQRPATGPVWDAAATIVFACSSQNLTAVYIGGKEAVVNGKATGENENLTEDVERRILRIRKQAGASASR